MCTEMAMATNSFHSSPLRLFLCSGVICKVIARIFSCSSELVLLTSGAFERKLMRQIEDLS